MELDQVSMNLYNQLLHQALKETVETIIPGVYDASPENIGKMLDRHAALCKEHGICRHCGQKVENCICDDLSEE
jgi:hypothetical protein